MLANPMNIPPVSIATAKAALTEQYAEAVLRRRDRRVGPPVELAWRNGPPMQSWHEHMKPAIR